MPARSRTPATGLDAAAAARLAQGAPTGARDGSLTNRSLEDYIPEGGRPDFVNARRRSALSLALIFAVVGCSDYDVSSSRLASAAESDEIVLAEGGAATLTAHLTADAEAMGANPTGFADITVFAVQESGSPRLYVSAPYVAADSGIAPTAFVELSVDDPFRRCDDPDAEGLDITVASDGACTADLPVTVRVEGGSVSLQVDISVQLNFGSQEPPGTLAVTLDE